MQHGGGHDTTAILFFQPSNKNGGLDLTSDVVEVVEPSLLGTESSGIEFSLTTIFISPMRQVALQVPDINIRFFPRPTKLPLTQNKRFCIGDKSSDVPYSSKVKSTTLRFLFIFFLNE